MRAVTLLFSLLLLGVACNDKKGTSAPTAAEESKPTTVIESDVKVLKPELNDLTLNLCDGLWHCSMVFERNPTDRYQAQKGRYYNFEKNGDYALFETDGSLLHFGKWTYEFLEPDRNYIHINAEQPGYNNQWKVLMSKEDAVFVGTDNFQNPGVQMRMEKLTTPPHPVEVGQ